MALAFSSRPRFALMHQSNMESSMISIFILLKFLVKLNEGVEEKT